MQKCAKHSNPHSKDIFEVISDDDGDIPPTLPAPKKPCISIYLAAQPKPPVNHTSLSSTQQVTFDDMEWSMPELESER